MDRKYISLAIVLLLSTQFVYVECWAVIIAEIGVALVGELVPLVRGIQSRLEVWIVEVHNEGKHDAHLWCASKNDRIGPIEGLWVKPGQKIAWNFRRRRTTQFWCNMDYNGQRVGWDVFVTNWRDAPNPTKWSIRNDGVYAQWNNRKWRNLRS